MSPKVAVPATILFVGLCLATIVTFAKAADAPVTEQTCFNVADAVKAADEQKGKFVALIDVPGDAADQLLVVDLGGLIQLWPALHGCMVAHPLALFESKKPDVPA